MIFDKRAFLANIILEFIKRGATKLPFKTIISTADEFCRLMLLDNKKMVNYLTIYDIRRLADKFYTCLHIRENHNVLEVSNPDLAKMWLESCYKSEAKGLESYLAKAVENNYINSTKSL